MRPDDAKTIGDFLLNLLDYEVSLTTNVLAAVPAGKLDYRPDALSKTALGLVRHLTLEDEWLLTAVADGQFTPTPDDSDACGIMTPAEAVARYKIGITTLHINNGGYSGYGPGFWGAGHDPYTWQVSDHATACMSSVLIWNSTEVPSGLTSVVCRLW